MKEIFIYSIIYSRVYRMKIFFKTVYVCRVNIDICCRISILFRSIQHEKLNIEKNFTWSSKVSCRLDFLSMMFNRFSRFYRRFCISETLNLLHMDRTMEFEWKTTERWIKVCRTTKTNHFFTTMFKFFSCWTFAIVGDWIQFGVGDWIASDTRRTNSPREKPYSSIRMSRCIC